MDKIKDRPIVNNVNPTDPSTFPKFVDALPIPEKAKRNYECDCVLIGNTFTILQ